MYYQGLHLVPLKFQLLKEIIIGKTIVNEITVDFAFELLSHMKGGPSIKVLLDVALGADTPWPRKLPR